MSTPDSRRPSNPVDDLGEARTWVLDGANLIGSWPDGWWRDRPAAARRLQRRIVGLLRAATPADAAKSAAANSAEEVRRDAPEVTPRSLSPVALRLPGRVILVLEGAARPGVPAGPVDGGADPADPVFEVVHAPRSGDDTVVELARTAPGPVLVVTSDRTLRDRVRAVGAATTGSGALVRLLEGF